MKHIDERRIGDLLATAKKTSDEEFDRILGKAGSLKRLSLEETARLLTVNDPDRLGRLLKTAANIKNAIYGNRVVLFVPLYTSNRCVNDCLYCAFRAGNHKIKRTTLSLDQITAETTALLARGHKRVLLVAGESILSSSGAASFYAEAVEAIYRAKHGPHQVRRVNINCAPLTIDGFKKLKTAGIGTYQIFQETYHDETYRALHRRGPKSDPDNRLDAIDRAFSAGIDDIGIGVLYGLYDYRFDTLALLSHIEYLEQTFGVGPHTVSVPRLEEADGSDLSVASPWRISDDEFKKVVAVLRLAVPYTGLILSTRETPAMRDELFALGISQASAGSCTAPGGYDEPGNDAKVGQFTTGDRRSLDEVIASLIKRGCTPSFCAACYRKERTGAAFMELARPGTIKGKCAINALITLKEYLDDFASDDVRRAGYSLIERLRSGLDKDDEKRLAAFFADIDKGVRDSYV